MVAAWRSIVKVPDFATQAASAFDCPRVGGDPGTAGPAPATVAALSAMLRGGNRNVPELVAAYDGMTANATPSGAVNALVSAYCPVVAGGGGPTYRKYAEIRRFSLEVAAAASPQAAAVPFPPVDTIWATPAGRSFVARLPGPFTGKITCPPDDGKLVPSELVAKAAAAVGKPRLPVGGVAAAALAARFATQNPKAAPADLANALIAAYCPVVVADAKADPALRFSWLEGFGEQVIQTLQIRAMTGAAEPAEKSETETKRTGTVSRAAEGPPRHRSPRPALRRRHQAAGSKEHAGLAFAPGT
jgi:hypothetical protein